MQKRRRDGHFLWNARFLFKKVLAAFLSSRAAIPTTGRGVVSVIISYPKYDRIVFYQAPCGGVRDDQAWPAWHKTVRET